MFCLVTIRLNEIAARAGVSVSTVSRVLNDRPGVNQHTRRQVLTAIDVLGYDRPSRLKPRSVGLVGLIIPELENPFFPRFAHLVENVLSRHGFAPVLCSQTLGGVHEDEYVRMLLEHAVSGIIFVSGIHAIADGSPERYQRLVDMGLPIVLRQRRAPGTSTPTSSRRTTRPSWSSGSPTSSTSGTDGSGSRSDSSATRPCSDGPRHSAAGSRSAGWCRTTCRPSSSSSAPPTRSRVGSSLPSGCWTGA